MSLTHSVGLEHSSASPHAQAGSETPDAHEEREENANERLILFSDGIIAFAITIAAISIKIPSDPTLLANQLTSIILKYFTYIVSFVVVALSWNEHHRLFHYIKRNDIPTKTLNTFCDAIKRGNYQTAYKQYVIDLQSQFGSEGKFAATYAFVDETLGKMTSCTVNTVNDSAGTGTITETFAGGSTLVNDYKLADEYGASKIYSQQPRSSPGLILFRYCIALRSGDYQTAYNQFSTAVQSRVSEDQFAASLSSNKVTDCTVSTVDDQAGAGTISYTHVDGSTHAFDYTLVNQNGSWRINSEQAQQ